MNTNKLILGIGSNLGNRWLNLAESLFYLQARIGNIRQISSVYESPSMDFKGNDFLNLVVEMETDKSPFEILSATREIEKTLGRQSKSIHKNYTNRHIDIDILYYNEEIINTQTLQIPHPEISKRNFVLFPLKEILPYYFHPQLQKTHIELVTLSPDKNFPKRQKKTVDYKKEIPFNFIAIEGNIGAGKTTFATQFARDFNSKLVLERFEENAFLPKFYQDPKRYAFPLEMSFLADRYQQLSDDLAQYDLFKTSVISDYYVFKSLIFAKVTLSEEEYGLYRKIFNFMYKDLVKPDLYIYLYQNIDRLLENIKKRGREYEQSIKGEYLEQIHEGYMNFIKTQKDLNVLILDISHIDFVKDPKYYHQMIKTIMEHSTQQKQLAIEKI
jgi:2-amino-4-hydroxy-6-hydroxymethyldihydropteridine diphosphokinase